MNISLRYPKHLQLITIQIRILPKESTKLLFFRDKQFTIYSTMPYKLWRMWIYES